MFYLCDNEHKEVCYSSIKCPVCSLKSTIDDLEEQISSLMDEIADCVQALSEKD